MTNARITSIEWGTLVGQRPREAGYNARLDIHGLEVNVPLVRLTTDDGSSGFGPCRTDRDQAQSILGKTVDDLLSPSGSLSPQAIAFEFALWDLIGQQQGKSVYQIVAEQNGKHVDGLFKVPCYDTSLYIDDLHLESDEAAAALIADEARFGYEHNHRNFKIKVGRGGRHMPIDEGTNRDILVIKAVRDAVGPKAKIMIDANNGYNLNLTKRVLAGVAACDIFWMEEAFHEDPVLYQDLHEWMDKEGIATLVADGEGQASPSLLDYAEKGIVEVVQYDIFSYGLANWIETGKKLDQWNIRTAPHHYGRHVGNYISGHLAAAVENFTFVEWDEVATPGLDGSAYQVQEGEVLIPDVPGFGLNLDESLFQKAVKENGFTL
ncbi:MAG: enolase C-terminal domain-like protein [Chloroflexota bacterium]